MSGIFLSLEGIDGSGKTTQIERLSAILRRHGHAVVTVREPGSTPFAEQVRAILLDNGTDIGARTELLLYLACRAQLVETVVRPALAEGAVVIADRFADSTTAYQGYGRELGRELVRQGNDLATAGLQPALTWVIDLPVEIAADRRAKEPGDRLEAEARDFHERVRRGFLELAAREPERVIVVDGLRSADAITDEIMGQLAARYPWLTGSAAQSVD